jgi:hypothetical protein
MARRGKRERFDGGRLIAGEAMNDSLSASAGRQQNKDDRQLDRVHATGYRVA